MSLSDQTTWKSMANCCLAKINNQFDRVYTVSIEWQPWTLQCYPIWKCKYKAENMPYFFLLDTGPRTHVVQLIHFIQWLRYKGCSLTPNLFNIYSAFRKYSYPLTDSTFCCVTAWLQNGFSRFFFSLTHLLYTQYPMMKKVKTCF